MFSLHKSGVDWVVTIGTLNLEKKFKLKIFPLDAAAFLLFLAVAYVAFLHRIVLWLIGVILIYIYICPVLKITL